MSGAPNAASGSATINGLSNAPAQVNASNAPAQTNAGSTPANAAPSIQPRAVAVEIGWLDIAENLATFREMLGGVLADKPNWQYDLLNKEYSLAEVRAKLAKNAKTQANKKPTIMGEICKMMGELDEMALMQSEGETQMQSTAVSSVLHSKIGVGQLYVFYNYEITNAAEIGTLYAGESYHAYSPHVRNAVQALAGTLVKNVNGPLVKRHMALLLFMVRSDEWAAYTDVERADVDFRKVIFRSFLKADIYLIGFLRFHLHKYLDIYLICGNVHKNKDVSNLQSRIVTFMVETSVELLDACYVVVNKEHRSYKRGDRLFSQQDMNKVGAKLRSLGGSGTLGEARDKFEASEVFMVADSRMSTFEKGKGTARGSESWADLPGPPLRAMEEN